MSWMSDLPGLPKRVRELEKWRKEMAKLNLAVLTANADAQGPVVTAVELAVVRALAAGDPAAQVEIDRLASVIASNTTKLVAVVESVPPDPPPAP